MKKISLSLLMVLFSSLEAVAELKTDFTTWTRVGFNLESSKSPFSFQLDQQLRLNNNSSDYQSYQTRFFGNYEPFNNNVFSLLYILTHQKENNINNVWSLQYINDYKFLEKFNWETRLRLEKRYDTKSETAKTEESWRGRIRGGIDYNINEKLKLLLNNELFFLENRGFSENRVQTGFNFKITDSTSIDLFYQNRYLNEIVKQDTLEHTIFTNINHKIDLD